MDVSFLLDPLNSAQRQAVSAPAQAMLVLAGAGSGKTKVLVHRIAWQIQVGRLSPYQILAVTFSNKAALEMRTRVEKLLNLPTQALWIGTFHGLAHRFLRRHAEQAGLPDTFQVMDSDDQLRLIKRLLTELGYDEKTFPAKPVQGFINAQKDEGLRASSLLVDSDNTRQVLMCQVYREYEQQCQRLGLVDFAELLLRMHELFRNNADVLNYYQQRFQAVHVDEFQDTNTIQYAWLRLLTEEQNNLFIVGDDDQSIYGWRGAKIENLHQFQQHYPQHQLVKLEQNYRSRGYILQAANHLIAHNYQRIGKNLWTQAGNGERLTLYAGFNDQDEAYFVVEDIKKWRDQGRKLREVAILYRSNAQSRLFEQRLMTLAIPYRVYGGLRFFERAEIKNALAYLRLIANRNDDPSFERIINIPTRGIGAKTLEQIRHLGRSHNLSLWQAAQTLLQQQQFSARAGAAVTEFLNLIKGLAQKCADLVLYEKVKLMIEHSGLIGFYQQEEGLQSEARLENLAELVNAALMFAYQSEEQGNLNELDAFLTHATLEAGEMKSSNSDDYVQLMTLHSAKGLEFEKVFLVGLEDGLFPSQQSLEDFSRLEEERRLCYVGITRAMHYLHLSYAETRRLYGQETKSKKSRFLAEIPAELIEEQRIRAHFSQPLTATTGAKALLNESRYRAGQRVNHPKFGSGTVLLVEGQGGQEKIQVKFSQAGTKWLMSSFVNLEIL